MAQFVNMKGFTRGANRFFPALGASRKFEGVLQVEDEIYSYDDGEYGKIDARHFVGVVAEPQKGDLLLGKMCNGEKIGRMMTYCLLSKDKNVQPMNYELRLGSTGTWETVNYEGNKVKIEAVEAIPKQNMHDNMRAHAALDWAFHNLFCLNCGQGLSPRSQEAMEEYFAVKSLLTGKDESIQKVQRDMVNAKWEKWAGKEV